MNARPKMRTFAALVSIAMLGVPQSAIPMPSETTPPSTASQSLTREEMEFLMGEVHRNHGNHATLSYLSQKEMSETEGKVGPAGAVVGAIGGAAGYIGTTIGSGNGSAAGLAGATLAGALGGFLAGPSGQVAANSILASQVGFYGGLAGGFVERAVNSCSSCHSARTSMPASEK